MKRSLIAVLCAGAAAALCLAGCASRPLVPPSAEVATVQAETSLELAYNVAAKAYLKRAPTMDPLLKARVKPLLMRSYEALQAAQWAQTLGTAGDLDHQVKATAALIAEAKVLLGLK